VIDGNIIRTYNNIEMKLRFSSHGCRNSPKYVNRELNSQVNIRGQNSHIELSDGALPISMLLWGATHGITRIYVMRMTSMHTNIQGDSKKNCTPLSFSPFDNKHQKTRKEGRGIQQT
jgi:hypothetical protein